MYELWDDNRPYLRLLYELQCAAELKTAHAIKGH